MTSIWIRSHRATAMNAKIMSLSAETFRAWQVCLWLTDGDGYLPDLRQVAYIFRVSTGEAERMLVDMIEQRLIDPITNLTTGEIRYRMHDWEHWQKSSDHSAKRVAKHRRNKARNGDVTGMKRSCNGDVTAQREREIETGLSDKEGTLSKEDTGVDCDEDIPS